MATGYGIIQNGGNCTAYVVGRLSEIMNEPFKQTRGNAIDFASSPYLQKIEEPQFGAVVVWSGNYYGHVAVVEEVADNGDILISESSWRGYIFKTQWLKKSENYANGYGLVFQGFYIAPEIETLRQEHVLQKQMEEFAVLEEVYRNTQSKIIIEPVYENVLLEAAAAPVSSVSMWVALAAKILI